MFRRRRFEDGTHLSRLPTLSAETARRYSSIQEQASPPAPIDAKCSTYMFAARSASYGFVRPQRHHVRPPIENATEFDMHLRKPTQSAQVHANAYIKCTHLKCSRRLIGPMRKKQENRDANSSDEPTAKTQEQRHPERNVPYHESTWQRKRRKFRQDLQMQQCKQVRTFENAKCNENAKSDRPE